MKFLCLISAENCLDQMTEADALAHLDEYRVLIERLERNGNYVECRRLMPADTAVTLRVRNNQALGHGRPLCRNQGATRRFSPPRSPKFRGSDRIGRRHSSREVW